MQQANKRTGQALYVRAKTRIPGGTQLLSKRPEMYLPDHWPSYYSRAQGAEVWDLDGRRYVDMTTNGLGSMVLGAADPDVNAAVAAAISVGSMSSLNCPEEVELADLLCDLHSWAEMVRFGRTGGEAMAVAVRIARACTGRDKIAFCGYHGWHDWYLSANLAHDRALDGHLLPGLAPTGVPRGLTGSMLPFRYNHIEELEDVFSKHGANIGAVVMEPIRANEPEPGFLERVRQLSSKYGSVLVFDEITAGFRLNSAGSHLLYGVNPDIAVFAKALSNGYPMAAIIGRRNVMEAAQDTFISSTYWTEKIGPAAALATVRKHGRLAVARHLNSIGQAVMSGWRKIADETGFGIVVGGIAPLAHLSFPEPQAAEKRTLFTQIMLDRGFLAGGSFYATYAHRASQIEEYLDAAHDALWTVHRSSSDGSLESKLEGPVAHSGFHRLT